jgi:hypothetical protein
MNGIELRRELTRWKRVNSIYVFIYLLRLNGDGGTDKFDQQKKRFYALGFIGYSVPERSTYCFVPNLKEAWGLNLGHILVRDDQDSESRVELIAGQFNAGKTLKRSYLYLSVQHRSIDRSIKSCKLLHLPLYTAFRSEARSSSSACRVNKIGSAERAAI